MTAVGEWEGSPLIDIVITGDMLVALDASGGELARATIGGDLHTDRQLAVRDAAVTLVRQAVLRLDPDVLRIR